MKKMTKWERVEAALHGADVDRVPIALWKHYHLQDRGPRQLANVTMALYRQFDFDLIKLTPSGLTPHRHALMNETLWYRDQETGERIYGPSSSAPMMTSCPWRLLPLSPRPTSG